MIDSAWSIGSDREVIMMLLTYGWSVPWCASVDNIDGIDRCHPSAGLSLQFFVWGEGGNFHGNVEKDVVCCENRNGGHKRYYHKSAYNLRTQIFHMGIHNLGYWNFSSVHRPDQVSPLHQDIKDRHLYISIQLTEMCPLAPRCLGTSRWNSKHLYAFLCGCLVLVLIPPIPFNWHANRTQYPFYL